LFSVQPAPGTGVPALFWAGSKRPAGNPMNAMTPTASDMDADLMTRRDVGSDRPWARR